jgi:FkbH-like protein
MGQLGRLARFSRQFITNRRYRNHVLDVINRHIQAEASEETRNLDLDVTSYAWLKGRRAYLVGGCELTYLKDALNGLGVETHHTFDHGESPEPLAAVSSPDSSIWQFGPDFILLSQVQVFRGLVAKVQTQGLAATRAELDSDLASIVDTGRAALAHICARLNRPVFLMTYPLVYRPAYGINDYRSLKAGYGLAELMRAYEQSIYGLAREFPNAFVLDVNLALERTGKNGAIEEFDADGVYEHFTRPGAAVLATTLLRQLGAIEPSVPRVKCIALDLDGTLWTGVLREDGPSGVSVRPNYLAILGHLARRGLLLAVCSKNDDVERASLPDLLGGELFGQLVSIKLNWQPKSQNLRDLASELNIGLDSIAFFDDSPFERAEVTANAPEVRVYSDTDLLSALDRPEFEPMGEITQEAASRTQKYTDQSLREAAAASSTSIEDFLRSSRLELTIRRPVPAELSRVFELLQRTNQLNATVRRTSQHDITDLYAAPDRYEMRVALLRDRFGDYGIIGLVLAQRANADWSILEMAFSCRSMGKHVEHAVLQELSVLARNSGATSLEIDFHPTDRNSQMLAILRDLGFAPAPALVLAAGAPDQTDPQLIHLVRDLQAHEIPFPDWLKLA